MSTPHNTSRRHRGLRLHRAGHDPRSAALVVLHRVCIQQHDSQEALDDVLRSPDLMPTDKGLCTELVYGTLRHYEKLRWFTCLFLRKPDTLPQEMLLALLTALYAMACLRMPHRASVHWTVSHIRNRFGPGLAAVANGTLRSLQRCLKEYHSLEFFQTKAASSVEGLSLFYAMPLWITQMWQSQYGETACLHFLAASLQAAPSGLRLNSRFDDWQELRDVLETTAGNLARQREKKKPLSPRAEALPACLEGATAPQTDGLQHTHAGPDADASPNARSKESSGLQGPASDHDPEQPDKTKAWVQRVPPCGLAFSGSMPWEAGNAVKQGRASRQSAASYEVLAAFAPREWLLPVWDCCAGRGGKTLALLEMGIPVALACDPSRRRLSALPEEYNRLRLTSPSLPFLLCAEAQDTFDKLGNLREGLTDVTDRPLTDCSLTDLSGQFGTILIDAPCSGLGTLSRHPEIRQRRTPEDIAALVALQRDILQAAARRLAPGGSIVYMTCTMNTAENQEQTIAFLQQHGEFICTQEYQTPADSPWKEFFYGAKLQKNTKRPL